MRSPPAPAALPVLAFLVAIGVGHSGLATTPALAVALLAAAVALGGRCGHLVAAMAVGFSLAPGAALPDLPEEPGRVTVGAGEICGDWSSGAFPGVASAPFCPLWLRQGQRLATSPASGRLELAVSLPLPPPGSVVEVAGALSRFPGFANEIPVAPGRWRLRVKAAAHLRVLASAPPWARWRAAWRASLDRAISRAAPPRSPGLALARGLVLGDVSAMDPDIVRALRRTGLAHLMAVSGFNVAVLLSVAGALAGRRRRHLRAALLVATIGGYLAIVGGAPSIERASIMALAGVAVFVLRRPGSALQALALAAGALVAAHPGAIADTGFQLSFGATAALVLVASRWAETLRPLPRPLAAAIATSVAAQAGTLPASVGAFGGLAPLAPLLNLVAVPWSALWMLVALLWTLLALLAPSAARFLVPLLDLGALPFGALERLPPSPWIAAWVSGGWFGGAALALAAALFFECRQPRLRRLWLLAPLVIAGQRAPERDGAMVLLADVGQGDAALVLGRRTSVLIDGGGLLGRDLAAQVLWPLVTSRADAHLDLVVLSHADSDHCGGLAALAAYVRFDELWLPPLAGPSACVDALVARVRAPIRRPRAGERFARGDLTIEILHPGAGEHPADDNAASLVLRLEADGRSVLFTGDIGGEAESRLARRAGGHLRSDLLKVPHHGSATSSSDELLAAVRPRWAAVSAGARNPFGHPSPAVLERLANAGARIARSDLQGELAFAWRRGEPLRILLPAQPRAAPP